MDTLFIYRTADGAITGTPPASSYSFTATLNDSEGSISLETSTAELALADCQPWAHSLAVVTDAGRVLAAGPIYKRDIDNGAGTVTLSAGSLVSILKRRILVNRAKPPVAFSTTGAYARIKTDGSVTTYQKTYRSTLAGIVLALIKDNADDLPGLSGIVVPSGTHTRTYDGLEMQTVADRLRDIFQTETPPTIAFDATLTPGDRRVTWTPREITTATRRTFRLNADAPAGPIAAWTITEDAGNETNRSWQVSQIAAGKTGSGSQPEASTSMFARRDNTTYTTTTPPGILLESVNSSHDNVVNGATLAAYAKAEASAIPYVAMAVDLNRAPANRQGIPIDEIRLGDVLEIATERGFYGPSIFAGIITQISGDADHVFSLDVEKVTRRPFN